MGGSHIFMRGCLRDLEWFKDHSSFRKLSVELSILAFPMQVYFPLLKSFAISTEK